MLENKYLIANWKMNLTSAEAGALAEEIVKSADSYTAEGLELVLCPSFDSLPAVSSKLEKSKVKLGAQDCFWEDSGAFTGAISPKFLAESGVKYVIIGHSERREHLGETDDMVALKIRSVLKNGLIPILCVGETFEQRREGQKDFVVMTQLARALSGLKLLSGDNLLVAYEPVWVIGSGQAVSPEEAEHTGQVVKQAMLDAFGNEIVKNQTAIIYGGSVNPDNLASFLGLPTIDGFLIGSASLDSKIFLELVKIAAQ